MKKIISLLFLFFATPAFATPLPANVITVTPAEIIQKIETSTQPFILVVFTSWCPYCRKQLETLARLTPAQQIQIPAIYAVSVDNKPQDYANYIRSKTGVFFPLRLYAGDKSLKTILGNYNSSFDGSIPYLAVFRNKKLAKEFNGYTEFNALKLAQ